MWVQGEVGGGVVKKKNPFLSSALCSDQPGLPILYKTHTSQLMLPELCSSKITRPGHYKLSKPAMRITGSEESVFRVKNFLFEASSSPPNYAIFPPPHPKRKKCLLDEYFRLYSDDFLSVEVKITLISLLNTVLCPLTLYTL